MIPVAAWSSGGPVNVRALADLGIGQSGALQLSEHDWSYCAEGAYASPYHEPDQGARCYAMLHRRHYALERVEEIPHRVDQRGVPTTYAHWIMARVLGFVARARSFYAEYAAQEIEGPYIACVSLRDLGGVCVSTGEQFFEAPTLIHQDSIDLAPLELALETAPRNSLDVGRWIDQADELLELLCHAFGQGKDSVDRARFREQLERHW